MKRILLVMFILLSVRCFGVINELDSENADRDLTSFVTVLTDTPDASNPILCQAYLVFGDGTKNLSGTGGLFEFKIIIGGQTLQPNPQIISFGTEAQSAIWIDPFLIRENTEVILQVKSPNGADTDVDVTAYLYDVFSSQVIEDAVWDASITGASHNDGNSAGKRLRQIEHVSVLREEEQAQGATSSTITLHDDASSINGFYDDAQVVIVGDTGIEQSRHIHAYVGSSRIASITPDWITTPDNTSDYVIRADSEKHVHEMDVDTITAATFASDVDAEFAAYIWNAATSGYGGVGTYGQAIEDVAGGLTAQQVWEYNISAFTNTAQSGGILIWLFNVAEGDEYIDTTQTPWQVVKNKKGTPGTEYLRKDLFDVAGGNVTATTTVIGKQTEP